MTSRFFAWGLDKVTRFYEPRITPRKRDLFCGLSGPVVEIGPGTGTNFKYMPAGTVWTGVDPNRHMAKYLYREAARFQIQADLLTGTANAIPLPDGSVSTLIGTLVLCSVPDPASVLQEVRRVLRPGGRYLFVEHVAAPAGSRTGRIQRAVRPVWRFCADGCHVDRDTEATVRAAGFATLDLERFTMPFPVVGPHIAGVAVR